MTFNAGSISADLTLDRRPFQTELAAAKKDAQDFARQRYTATVHLDDVALKAELARLKIKLDEISRDRVVKIKVAEDPNNNLRKVKKDADEADKSLGLLHTAIAVLGPPLVPLAGGLLAISTAAVGLGASGITAFVGIKNEVNNNTQAGKTYRQMLGGLKGDLNQISQTSQAAANSGLTDAVDKLRSSVPQLNGFLSKSSTILGDITDHLIGGIIGGFKTFEPLMLTVEQGVDNVAAKFESWATGPGGARFAKTLGQDYQAAVPALKSLGQLVVTIGKVFNGPTSFGLLHLVTALADTINSFPLGLLQAMATAWTAWRLTVSVTRGIELATGAILKLNAATKESDVVGGTGGAAGSKAGGIPLILSRATGIAIALFAVGEGAKAAAGGMGDYTYQTSKAKFVTGQLLDSVGKLFTGHVLSAFSSAGDNLSKHNAFVSNINNAAFDYGTSQGGSRELKYTIANNDGPVYTTLQKYNASGTALATAIRHQQDVLKAAQSDYNAQLRSSGDGTDQAIADAKKKVADAQSTLTLLQVSALNLSQLQRKSAADQQTIARVQGTYTTQNSQANTAAYGYALGASTYSDAASSLASYGAQLTKNIASEKTWNALQVDSKGNINKNKAALAEWNKALTLSGGNTTVAIGIIKGHQQAYVDDIAAQKQAALAQGRINSAVSQAATAYGLTTQQVQLYGSMVGITAERLASGAISQQSFTSAIGAVKTTLENGTTAMDAWSQAVNTFLTGEDNVASRGALIGAALRAANGDTIAYQQTLAGAAQANQQLVTDMESAKKGIIDWQKATVNWHTAGGAQVLNDLQNIQTAAVNSATAIYQHETALGKASAADDAFAAYQQQTQGALIKTAEHFGATKVEAQKFADTYFGIKNAGDLKKTIELAGKDNVTPLLQGILNQLRSMQGLPPLTFDVVTYFDANTQKLFAYQASHVHTEIINARTGANGFVLDSYANGGVRENHIAQIAPAGTWRVWAEDETGGESYIPLAPSKRERSMKILHETARRFGVKVSQYADGSTPDFGFQPDYSTGKSGSSSSSSSSSTSKYKTLLASLVAEIAKLGSASKQSLSYVSSLSSSMLSSFKTANSYGLLSTSTLKNFTYYTQQLTASATKLDAAQNKLKTDTASYNALIATDRNTVLGQFDIGTSGNGYGGGILSSLKSDVANTSKFKGLIAQAQKLGLSKTLVQKLISEGPTTAGANLQAIISSAAHDSTYISQLNSNYAALGTLGTDLGTTDAASTYGSTLASDKAAIAAASKAETAWLALLHKDLVAVESAVSRKTHS